ncbi:hypothetical protein [Conexibacter sp. SYSU D00693]|uniref:hypothetical protein n=1 Tax=Conexibacter sp. SYSU D00693 TaxID=2812560 RepID=UPI00196B2A2F|nr:hypothetical protein [Conexibacter sp. SYSU D00693]
MDRSPQLPGRPRPVAGLPPLDADAVAHAWLLALLAGRPLDRAELVPVGAVAVRGPDLVRAVAAAVADDRGLEGLDGGAGGAGPSPAEALHDVTGAAGPADAVAAVEALRRAIGAAWLRADPEVASAAGDRLAHACARLAAAAAATAAAPEVRGGGGPPVATDAEVRAARLVEAEAEGAVIALEAAPHTPTVASAPAVPDGHVLAAEPGRWLVVVPADGARAVAERLAAQLGVHAGVAVREGDEAGSAVVARADERCFAARAAGQPVA